MFVVQLTVPFYVNVKGNQGSGELERVGGK
jgi:hypothetical protein